MAARKGTYALYAAIVGSLAVAVTMAVAYAGFRVDGNSAVHEIVFEAGDPRSLDVDNSEFRDRVAGFVREVADNRHAPRCSGALASSPPAGRAAWTVTVTAYRGGAVAGTQTAPDAVLCEALRAATLGALGAAAIAPGATTAVRFTIEIGDRYAIVESRGRGHELSHGVITVRRVDRPLLARRIDDAKEYLFRVIDRERGGAHKYYHAPEDRLENRLHTIYTSSLLYTMRLLGRHQPDPRIDAFLASGSEFVLSMQNRAPNTPGYGGFHYSLDTAGGQREDKFVVGTASKTIFTLLALHGDTGDARYRDAAVLAADWLLTMQRKDGGVNPYLRLRDGKWMRGTKESLLYTGQVLSALSRTYRVTGDTKYLDAANLTARYLSDKVASRGCYLGDAYREPNPISSSWLVYSLFDYFKASGDAGVEDMVFRCADMLLARQIDNPSDVYRHGRWRKSLSSSGNGWLAEVVSELHDHCQTRGRANCDKYRDAVVGVARWILQHAYTEESTFAVENPEAARGGVFWNVDERYVRTDSVCHATNAFINILDDLQPGSTLELREAPLARRL